MLHYIILYYIVFMCAFIIITFMYIPIYTYIDNLWKSDMYKSVQYMRASCMMTIYIYVCDNNDDHES